MDAELRKKYLQAGEAVLERDVTAAASLNHAVGAGNDALSVPAQRKPGGGTNLLRWFWRLVKFALLLLVLFVALCVYYAVMGPGDSSQKNDSIESEVQQMQSVQPAGSDVATTAPSSPTTQAETAPVTVQAETSTLPVASSGRATLEQPAHEASLPASEAPVSPPAAVARPTQSSATASIRNFVIAHTGDTDCGDLSDVYCRADLLRRAARLAYDDSVRCEQQQSGATECAGDGHAFIDRRVHGLEIQLLMQERTNLQNYLLSPVNTNLNNPTLQVLAEPCKQQAINDGLHGAAFFAYARHTCLPLALEGLLRPKKELLRHVEERLEQLNSPQ
ncbi:hypothetical protein CBA19CS11_32260 [Caballeronia novacaledonica]|uniref:hypothetical protein n=1 Tax=Caballeronia novacaledonica TaxID=1544861 RepID=UPI001EE2D5D2|nr:hypothetical protein [Caballeronia novacaledonica]GJH13612.1 hypothetical protein CBA19CS11_32260 [Caballeronia novacaledonica]